MKCPSCGSLDLRLSKRHLTFSPFYQLRGFERYRCRNCHHAFWERPPSFDSEKNRRKRARAWAPFFQTRRRRVAIEVTMFLGMLIIFVYAIRYLVNRSEPPGPVGDLRPPPTCVMGDLMLDKAA